MLNLVYGKQPHSIFLDAGEVIAEDFTQSKFFEICKKLNNTFFGGGIFASKSFEYLTSVTIPNCPTHVAVEDQGQKCIIIGKQVSLSSVIGIVEGIPVIGSAIAAVKTIYHVFGLLHSYSSLKKSVKHLYEAQSLGDRGLATKEIFTTAVNLTKHQNHLVGSLLSIIPLVKPIIRITQGILFNVKNYHYTIKCNRLCNPILIITKR